MKDMAQDTFEIVTGASESETIVRKRKPPLSAEVGCVQKPVLRGAGTRNTPSYVVFGEGNDESSDAVGRINEGDSVNEREIADVAATVLNVSEMRPPTCGQNSLASIERTVCRIYLPQRRNPEQAKILLSRSLRYQH